MHDEDARQRVASVPQEILTYNSVSIVAAMRRIVRDAYEVGKRSSGELSGARR